MSNHFILPALLLCVPVASAVAQDSTRAQTRICLAPSSVEAAATNAGDAATAVRETFTSYLTGPTLAVTPLNAKLESQVREEAKAAGCPYLLLTKVKHVRKSGGGLLGRMAGSAAQQAAWSVGGASSSTAARIATSAAAGAASAAAYNYATSTKTKDELTLLSRLESATGQVLVEKTEKKKAQSDGEDLVTPLVEKAASDIAAVVAKH